MTLIETPAMATIDPSTRCSNNTCHRRRSCVRYANDLIGKTTLCIDFGDNCESYIEGKGVDTFYRDRNIGRGLIE